MAIKPSSTCCLEPEMKPRCACVSIKPEDNKIKVFNKGTPKGSKVLIPFWGHVHPIAIVGWTLEVH